MFIFANAWLLPFVANPVLLGIAIVITATASIVIANQIQSSTQPFGNVRYINEVDTQRSLDSNYNEFVVTENSPVPKVEGEQETEENATEAQDGDGKITEKGKSWSTGFPENKGGISLNDAEISSSSAVIDTNNPNFYQNRDPIALVFEITKERLYNRDDDINNPSDNTNKHPIDPSLDNTNFSQVNQFNKTELGSPDVDLNRDKWIAVDNPTPITNTGSSFVIPLINYTYELRSAPVTGNDVAIFDPTEIVTAINNENASSKYFDNLMRTHLGHIESTEEDIKLSEQTIVFLPAGMIGGLEIQPIIGIKALHRMKEAFHNYSFGSQSKPLYRIPKKVNISTIKGINETKNPAPINQDIENLVKPFPSQYLEKMTDNYLIPSGTELDVELLMRFLGNTEIYQGGEFEYNKLNKEFKDDPNAFYNSPFIQQTPSIADILNGEDKSPLQLKTSPSQTKVESQFDLLQKMVSLSYMKTGLDQFPTNLPSLQEPDFSVNSVGKRFGVKPKPDVVIPSLAGGLGYGIGSIQKNIGSFPLEVETEKNEGEKDTEYVPDLGTGLSQALTIGLVGLNLAQNNFNLNMTNSKTLKETKSIASKGASCACATMDATGMNKNPSANCQTESLNFKDAKGMGDFFNGSQVCHTEDKNVDPTTIKEMLQDISFGVNIIKGAFFKSANELDEETGKLAEIKDNITSSEENLDNFIEKFNKGKSQLSQNYPTKSKIIKKDSID